jgi:hypothetical protein
MSFISHHVERRTRKNTFFKQINKIIDWQTIEKEICKAYKRPKWFGAEITEYIGLKKTHFQHVIEAIAYNLYRSPGIVMSNCKKTL